MDMRVSSVSEALSCGFDAFQNSGLLQTKVLGLLCMPFWRSKDSVSGTDFVAWAHSAETSMMPSSFDWITNEN